MHLEPALDPDAPFHFAFTRGAVSDLVSGYEAVSYTWGEPKLDYLLHIDGASRIMVTRNLDKVLRKLRHPTKSRTLWADAVCINQAHDDEKPKQIPFMAMIFCGASKVLACLGDGVEEERGMRHLHTVAMNNASFVSEEKLPESWPRDIDKFFSLAWFTRIWVIQEIVVNMDTNVICSTSETHGLGWPPP